MTQRSRVLKSRTVFRGRVIRVDVDLVSEPGGVQAIREVVRHRGSVVLLSISASGQVLLVRQFRYAAKQFLWELPAGRVEWGESVLRAARRELEEETGFKPFRMERVLTFYSSPGFLDEKMALVRAEKLKKVGANPDADERITARFFSIREIKSLLPKIADGKTLVGLLWYLKGTS